MFDNIKLDKEYGLRGTGYELFAKGLTETSPSKRQAHDPPEGAIY